MDAEHFLHNHMHHFLRSNPTPQLISMPHQQNPELRQNYESLPHELKALFDKLFNSQKVKINLKDILPFKPRKSNVAYCHRILTPKTQSYRCFDCQIHPESLLCEDCFKRGNHDSHRYIQLKDEGSCDCGSKYLIKEEGFCPIHTGAQEIIQVDSSEEFVFNLYVRQLFIWILKLIKIQQKDGEIFLLYFLNYLTQINDQSPYYNKLTTRTIFAEKDPFADYIFFITLNAAERGKLVQASLNLFFKMLALQQFKERLLTSLIINYNKIQNFESSKYVKLLYPLLNETEAVINAMNKNPVPLRPQRRFNVIEFYRIISITKSISPAAAQAFLRPLLLIDVIVFPFLNKVEQQCEKLDNLIVTVFPEFQKEEHIYYKLLCDIIKVTNDKQVLAAMIANYCKLIMMYSFNKNKIILVPQRILVLLIYKYFDCDLMKVDAYEIRNILGLQQQTFLQQICKNWVKFAECLFQFAANLNRTNYFENYISIYAKEKGQIICIDYLGFKIMAALSKDHKQTFETVLEHIFRVDYEKQNKQADEKGDLFKTGNIFLKIIIEIIYSPRAQFIVNSLLGHENLHLSDFLKGLCRSTGDVTQQQLDNIGYLLTFKEQIMQNIGEAVSFDPVKRKYIPISRQNQNEINLQFFVSLLQTQFSKFIQRKTPSEKYLQLDDGQQQLKEILLNCDFLYIICLKQMMLIENHPERKMLLKQMIRVLKTIRLAYGKQQKEYQDLFIRIYKQIRRKYVETQSSDCPNRLFLQEIQGEISNSTRVRQRQQVKDKQSQKRKELLRLKKQKLMKERKIKQNQQKFIEPQKVEQQNQTEEMCLICRENKDSDQICYVGKLRFSTLLYNFLETQGQNAIFKSCFHTVHFDCFMQMQKRNQAALCPLCKCAINIVLPLQTSDRYSLLQKTSNRIQHVLNYFIISGQTKQKRSIIIQIISYFTYMFAVNIDDLAQITARQLRLCKLLFNLLDHNMSFDDRQQQADAYFELFISKMKTKHKLLIYRDLLKVVESVTFWHANNYTEVEQPLECLYDLSFHYTLNKILQILTIINKFISSPETSALEPLIIAFQKITPKIQDQIQEIVFVSFWKPPEDVNRMLQMRDACSSLCKTGHQMCFCQICHMPNCLTCKQTAEHCTNEHPRQCLMFNTFSGGFIYYYHGLEVMIKCLFVNEIGKTWKPELKTEGFNLDRKVYNQILQQLKGGSLFNYLITTFEGLKGNNITDRI